MTCTAGPRHRFRQSLLLGWVKMPVKDWLLLHVAPCDSYAILGPGWDTFLPHATPLGAMRDRTTDGVNGLVGDEEVDVRSIWAKGVVTRTIQSLAPLPPAVL